VVNVHARGVVWVDAFANISDKGHQTSAPRGACSHVVDVDGAIRRVFFGGDFLEPFLNFAFELDLEGCRHVHQPVDMSADASGLNGPDERRRGAYRFARKPSDEVPTAEPFKYVTDTANTDGCLTKIENDVQVERPAQFLRQARRLAACGNLPLVELTGLAVPLALHLVDIRCP